MERMLKDLMKKHKLVKSDDEEDYEEDQGRIFARWIRDATPLASPFPTTFKDYDGKSNAKDHISKFEVTMLATSKNKAHWCTCFAGTLTGKAAAWMRKLKKDSIDSWPEFKKRFLKEFAAAGALKKDESSLFELKQREKESLSAYIKRFNNRLDLIDGMDEKSIIFCFMGSLQPGPLKTELRLRTPKTRAEMMLAAERIAAEDRNNDVAKKGKKKRDRRIDSSEEDEVEDSKRKRSKGQGARAETIRPAAGARRAGIRDRQDYFTPLNRSREHIMTVLRAEGRLTAPPRMNPEKAPYRDQTKRCAYHEDVGHETEHCKQLKRAIQRMIEAGELNEFKAKYDRDQERANHRDENANDHFRRPERRLNIITTITEKGVSIKHIKSKIFSLSHNYFVPGEQLELTDTIGFKQNELAGPAARDQPIIIEIEIGTSLIRRVLVDTGATKDIMFYNCFKALGVPDKVLRPTTLTLEGFTNHQVSCMGTVQMEVVLAGPKIERRELVEFVVIDVASPYNVILGTPSQGTFGMVASIAHQRVKFLTDSGVGCLLSNPKYYYNHLIEERKASKEVIITPDSEHGMSSSANKRPIASIHIIEASTAHSDVEMSDQNIPETNVGRHDSPRILETDCLDVREGLNAVALEETEELIINPDHPEQKVKVGKEIAADERNSIIEALKSNLDVFAWKVEDMEGISEEVAEHRLNILPNSKVIRQKVRIHSGEKEKAIKEEIDKLLRAKIIREVTFATWIANVVMVLKANKKWRMCVDYVDLNKACPKDSYPLPRINRLVDAISGHKILSFIDAYSGYHQIKMHPDDEIHTGFHAAGGTYCYVMMPFGLKNAGASYQRMVNKVFGDQIGRNVEAYIDDMVIKTRENNHVLDLLETFENLRRNHMKLNPSKCAFGVTSGKFLGFMVSERGIEANPEKIQALVEMRPPRTINEIQRLNGRIVALSRFISRSAEKCLPFFKALRGGKNFKWTQACDDAFIALKEYLGRPPLLTSPISGDTLFVYLAATDRAVAAALLREEGSLQRPIYYVSHALTEVETRYLDAEKIALALIIAARRLRAYFMAHSIVVYSNFPMKNFLFRPDVSGRMLRWSIELTEFDIIYRPRKAIKAQALVDFIVEASFAESSTTSEPMEVDNPPERPEKYFTLYVDGSSGVGNCGAGVLLITPDHDQIEKAIRFKFPASNNQAEYEALIAGLQLAHSITVRNIVINSDSQLVVKQISGEYSVNHPVLAKYAEMSKSLLDKFKYWELVQIDRAQNTRADELSKLACDELINQNPSTTIEFLERPIIDNFPIMVIEEEREKDWVDNMAEYIEHDILPADPREALLLKKRSPRFTVVAGILYRRSFTNPLLRCIPPRLVLQVLHEVHKGACGTHPGARTLAEKIISAGYYWPSLRNDATEYVQKCDICQRYGDTPRLPAVPQTPIVATWPFDMWGLDAVGGLTRSPCGFEYLLVAVDYFSKWVEAMPVRKVDQASTIRFVHDQIWCRFGLPRAIICDNGTNFVGKRFTQFLKAKGVQHWPASVSHPEGNGQAEAANKLIVYGLKKILVGKKGRWREELDRVLWSIRTTKRGPTKETPFALAYGSEAMVPIETNIPSARVIHYHANENLHSRQYDLDFLEERRLQAGLHMAYYKQKTKEYHDKKVNPRSFQVGDLVLRKISSTNHPRKDGKLGPTWEGPLIVAKIVREGTYRLREQDGTIVKNPWHADHLKKYYP